ncbi:uncharacterized protein CC84DRAFT_1219924 [Paraphaeosphaeria sporulosa]|uniref:Uncharacterized protein n=1 Tax=Paraphaeosphaeria sporulosa TaxID=1460663 RepID=A0A177C653_9PLEO|nr:uncharacterized protein CC84DRAFT_1219924 [Paraphaeosphaeria sporulosa]OAG03005.1 hypothetical protein CC84DRAFT_1219924 [Paraphaeosphaeria sporulosa]
MEIAKVDTASKPEKTTTLLKPVYEASTVQLFWNDTSEKVNRTVNAAAYEPRTNALAKKLSKRLSLKQKKLLDGSSLEELENMLQLNLDRAIEQQTADRTSAAMLDRAERKTTRFLNSFHSYVQAYSGVIQIMNGAPGGGGYGDAAYGALSLFLMFAVNKAKTDELIDQMMHKLHQQYCRIKMVETIYHTDRMKEFTAQVYRLGVEFLYTATRFYSMSAIRKMWHVVAQPPSVQLTNKIAEIEDAIEGMAQEMRILDGIRIANIEMNLHQTAAQVSRVAGHTEALRAHEQQRQLDSMKSLLGVVLDRVDPSLDKYLELLEERFDGANMATFDVDALYRHRDFATWRNSDVLNLLILRDSTLVPGMSDLSWLSPVPVRIVQDSNELFQEHAPLLLRHFCRFTDDWSSRDTKVEAQSIVRSLIFQLLRNRRSGSLLLNDAFYNKTKRDIEHVNGVDAERPSEILKRLFRILGSIMEMVGVDRLLIIVDRLDEMIGSLDAFFEPLSELIAKHQCKVKVLLTLGRQRSLDEGRMRRALGEEGYKILDWDQSD